MLKVTDDVRIARVPNITCVAFHLIVMHWIYDAFQVIRDDGKICI